MHKVPCYTLEIARDIRERLASSRLKIWRKNKMWKICSQQWAAAVIGNDEVPARSPDLPFQKTSWRWFVTWLKVIHFRNASPLTGNSSFLQGWYNLILIIFHSTCRSIIILLRVCHSLCSNCVCLICKWHCQGYYCSCLQNVRKLSNPAESNCLQPTANETYS